MTRSHRYFRAIIIVALLSSVAGAGCNLTDPDSPTSPASLTGNNTNAAATFNGTLAMFGGGTVPANDATDALVVVEARDPSGNPVTNGTPVNVSTTLGTIRPTGSDPATAGSGTSLFMFEGRAAFALRSAIAGEAVVTAWIADVAIQGVLRFDATQTLTFVTLSVRGSTGDVPTLETTAPAQTTLVAKVTASNGAGIPGQRVRFSLAADSSANSGHGAPQFLAPEISQTDSAGEAFTALSVRGVGTVALLAELIDTAGNVRALSNQALITTTAIGQAVAVTLTFSTGATVETLTPPGSIGLSAAVTDLRTGATLGGRRVRFVISSDTAQQERAELANSQTLTDGAGLATNAITVTEPGSTIAIYAELLSDTGQREVESNQVILTTGAPLEETITLSFPGSATVSSITAPDTIGLQAVVSDQNGVALVGRTVTFAIVADTATTTPAVLASGVPSLTDSSGTATDAITGFEAGSTVTIVARVLNEFGAVIQESNQVVLAVE